MKKPLLLAAIALIAASAGAQNYKLMVTKANGATVTIPTSDISKIEFVEQQSGASVKGDLLDIEFLADGTAKDRSPMHHEVITQPGANLMTYYSDLHGRYVANFRNTMGETVTNSYYRINYTKGGDFINRIADGCTFETIIKLNEPDNPGREVKWFSSMQGGGIGFILPYHDASKPGSDCLTFLPNISTTGASTWCWTYSNVVPVPGLYYHVVGVYDKEQGRTYIYVNGELGGMLTTPGNYVPVQAGAESFVIGGDPSTNQTNCDSSFNGEVVSVRIYDKAMTAEEVAALWADEAFEQPKDAINVTDLRYQSNCEVGTGYKYSIYGKGFADGDAIEMIGASGSVNPAVAVADGRITLTIPANLQSGDYKLVLKRGEAQLPLFTATFNVSANPVEPSLPKVIAHRGAHTDGASENSIAALKKAMDANYFGIELDVWITKDGKLVVHHDGRVVDPAYGSVSGKYFYLSDYDEIKDIKLSNGEALPTFDSFVETFKQKMSTSTSNLIIEIKTHGSARDRNNAAIDKVMATVEAAGMKDRVEYIAFDFENCKYIVSKQADAKVGYLMGDLAPSVVKAAGVNSIDYSYGTYANHINWIKEARDLGMITNVWTVNSTDEMMRYRGYGIDYITTDAPATLKELNSLIFIEK